MTRPSSLAESPPLSVVPPLRLSLEGGILSLVGPAAPERPRSRSDDPQALRLLEQTARREPDDPDYHYILGQELLRAGRVHEAAASCREAAECSPLDAEYQLARGTTAFLLGRLEEAEDAFRTAGDLRPGDAQARSALGATLVRLQRPAEAAAVLAEATAADPQLADARANRGVALLLTGDAEGGLTALRHAVRLAPEEPAFARNLGLALGWLGRGQEAVPVLRRIAERLPGRAEAHLDLAEALHDCGRHDEAARALDEAARLDPLAIARRPRSRDVRDALGRRALTADLAEARRTRARIAPARLAHVLTDAAFLVLDTLVRAARRHPPLSAAGLACSLGLFASLTWGLGPHYVARWLLEDDMTLIARAPSRDDAFVREALSRAVRHRRLDGQVDPSRCLIATEPAWRRISCDYEVETQFLPGVRRTLHLRVDVEQPYFVEDAPQIF